MKDLFKILKAETDGEHIMVDIALTANTAIKSVKVLNKATFEHWLSEGTGYYEATISTVNSQNEQVDHTEKVPVENIWDETPAVVADAVSSYVKSNEYLLADFATDLQYSEILEMTDGQPELREKIMELSRANRNWGMSLIRTRGGTNVPSLSKSAA